ncbi:hypothetical protein K2Z84_16440 [Candidatus Binatia bacterium]|jgi:hypothetical protein|nr:hypothetical protein [Candidatus Binatia bacterium]
MRTPLALAALALIASPALAVDITAPGQVVPKRRTGVVQADLVCAPGEGIALENGATLKLDGHTLDGCSITGVGGATERIRIAVRGPGAIHGAGISIAAGTLRVRDVVIQDPPLHGIYGANGVNGGPSKIDAADVQLSGSGGTGIEGTRVVVKDVTVDGFTDHGVVGWAKVDGKRLTVSGCGEGVFSAENVHLRSSQVTASTAFGVIANLSVELTGSTVTGNGTDVASQILPKLNRSTCGTSLNMQTATPWGVCSGD